MDEHAVEEMLASDKGVAEVREELAEGVERGITAVPTFVIDGQWGIPGAQETDVFVKILERMLAREAAAHADAR